MAISTLLKAIFLAGLINRIATSIAGNLTNDLQPLLSSAAEIYYPGSVGYTDATIRWSGDIKPGLDVIVKVASEEDVQAIIQYANSYSIPFLAISGGHGTSSFLSTITCGIGIYLRGLSGVSLSPTNTSQALILGGTLAGEVISGLWDLGKQSVTGACDCTGFISPMLGGGHGWLQGRYGLLADNLVSARVVLANGTAITVDETQHSDLFWGLRGAGHNFGIVTSVYYQIYNRTPEIDGFMTATFTFTQDKLEDVFTIANGWLAAPNPPVELAHFGIIAIDPAVDPKPIVNLLVIWQGNNSIPTEYTTPLRELKPVSVVEGYFDLLSVNANTGASYSGPACQEGMGQQLFPVILYSWDLINLRTVINLFSTFPTSLGNSLMLLEAYAANRVLEIPAFSTAYAFRSYKLLTSPLLTYPANNKTLDEYASRIGRQIRAAMLNGTGLELRAYVNYANGDESQNAVYGYEPWRLQRLRKLKERYDPFGRFNFYEPIKV